MAPVPPEMPATRSNAGWNPAAILTVAIAYAAVAKFGSLTTTLPGGMSPIFPSAGIALAAVLILGRPALLGVWLGSFAANNIIYTKDLSDFLQQGPKRFLVGISIGLGAVLAAWAGALIVRRLSGADPPLSTARSVLVLVTVGALGAGAVSAAVGLLTLSMAGVVPWQAFGYSWITWLLGDAFGCVIAAPLVLAWHQRSSEARRPGHASEAITLGGVTLLLSYLVFFRNWPFEYGLIPPLIWAAFRFGMRGTSTAAATIAVLATIGTSGGTSPFARGNANDSLLALHSFLGVTIVFALLLAGVLLERRRAVGALQESEKKALASEERLRQAAKVSGIGVFDHDHRTGAIFWSPEQRAHYGWERDEPVTLAKFVGQIHPDDRARIDAAIRRAHDPAGDGSYDVEHRITRRDGEERWLSTRSLTQFEGEGPARRAVRTTGATNDVTARKRALEEHLRLEERLRQSQKMEAIGTLAGGIAHDFNNILAVIMASAEVARLEAPKGSETSTDLEAVVTAAERARLLVSRILTFSRRGETRPVPCDVRPIVKEALTFLRAALPSTIEIREHLATAGTVVVDPTQLHQVVMNLGTNAAHAMEARGGVLEVKLGGLLLADPDAANQGLAPGAYAMLTVSDTGIGIPPELLGRIFEPYFTTREAGKGTGLGLAVVHGIVTAAGGALRVYSEPGLGTTFHVYLPSTPAEAAGASDREERVPRGTEHILLVDDESMIVAMQQKSLEALGYRVTSMTSGEKALEIFLADPGKFDILITDLTMPRLGGEGLSRAALQARPDLPVLICTGFSEELASERVLALGVSDVLMKPVPRLRLASAIRSALDHPRLPRVSGAPPAGM